MELIITNRVKHLRKAIYQEAMKMVLPEFKHDKEEVSAMRDKYTNNMFGKRYDELTANELQRVFDRMSYLNRQSKLPKIKSNGMVQNRASKAQIARLRYLALWYAINYARLDGLNIVNKNTGEIYENERLREILNIALDKNQCGDLYFTLINELYIRSANPKCNALLMEGTYKSRILKASSFYYESLPEEQADYLIRRFMKIQENSQQRNTRFSENENMKFIQENSMSLN